MEHVSYKVPDPREHTCGMSTPSVQCKPHLQMAAAAIGSPKMNRLDGDSHWQSKNGQIGGIRTCYPFFFFLVYLGDCNAKRLPYQFPWTLPYIRFAATRHGPRPPVKGHLNQVRKKSSIHPTFCSKHHSFCTQRARNKLLPQTEDGTSPVGIDSPTHFCYVSIITPTRQGHDGIIT